MTQSTPSARRFVLVTDFDGTITDREFYDLAVSAFLPPDVPDYWRQYASGEISHFDAISGIFSHLRCSEEQLRGLIGRLEPDCGFGRGVEALRGAGWDVVVVSNGCNWYIEPLLERLGVQVKVYASEGRFVESGGLVMQPPSDSPYFNPRVGIDKERLVRDFQQRYECVAFAGNGSPDRAAALAVPAELRFARRWLAKWLEGEGHSFCRFERWSDIADALINERPA